VIEGYLKYNNNFENFVDDEYIFLSFPATYTFVVAVFAVFVDLLYLYLAYKGSKYSFATSAVNKMIQFGCMIYIYTIIQDLKDDLNDQKAVQTKAIEGLTHWQIGSIGFMGSRLINLFALLVLVVNTQSKNRTKVLVHLAAQQPQQNLQQPNVNQPPLVYQGQQQPNVNQQQQPYANQPLPVYTVKSPLLQNNQSSEVFVDVKKSLN